MNKCKENPCTHGTCNNSIHGYSCACHSGYIGRNCSIGKFSKKQSIKLLKVIILLGI